MRAFVICGILKIINSEKSEIFTEDQFEIRNYDLNVRRYIQLAEMMNFYNHDFDEKKYWAYGCNCLIIGKKIYKKPTG